MKTFVIINPASGAGRGLKCGMAITRMLGKRGLTDFKMQITCPQGGQNAFNLAKAAANNGCQKIIVVGGDGTVNEVVNGITGSDIVLAIIPAGCGNDLARNLGIPTRSVKKALKCALFGQSIKIDLGRINFGAEKQRERLFANVVSFGFDARVTDFSRILRYQYGFLPPRWTYLIALIKELLSSANYPEIELTCSSQNIVQNLRSTCLVVANGPQYGGIFKIAPAAKLSDGMLDICWIAKMSRISMLIQFSKVIFGKHTTLPEVTMFSLPTLNILSLDYLACEIDGEVLPPVKCCKIAVIPKALNVMVPRLAELKSVRVDENSKSENSLMVPTSSL